MTWDLKTLKGLHREYLAGAYPSALAKRRKRTSAQLLRAFKKNGLKILPRKSPRQPRRIPMDLISAMHAEYLAGATFAELERKHKRSKSTVRDLFVSRGLYVRPPAPNAWRKHRADGSWERKDPATDEEITAAIKAATKLVIPESLKLDWRHWDLARRGEFIRRLKAHLNHPRSTPSGPYSSNVQPFDYTSPAAWAMLTAANSGRGSRSWALKMDIGSEGVIYEGRLWFWNQKMNGYMSRNHPDGGTYWLALHRHIYTTKVGPIPTDMTVRFRDRNQNNFLPSNLYLCPKQEVCRENQHRALNRKSAERAAAILNLHNQPRKSHVIARSLSQSGKRSA